MLPVLRRQRGGHLVLVGSVLGDIAAPFMTAYVVSKWGIRSLGRQLALENRDLSGVHVSVRLAGRRGHADLRERRQLPRAARPPAAPVTTPERVAKAVLRVLDHPRDRRQVGIANNLMRAGFTVAPWAFDALVGPLFRLAALDRTRQVPATPGSVLSPERHALRGRLPNAATAIVRNLRGRPAGVRRPGDVPARVGAEERRTG